LFTTYYFKYNFQSRARINGDVLVTNVYKCFFLKWGVILAKMRLDTFRVRTG